MTMCASMTGHENSTGFFSFFVLSIYLLSARLSGYFCGCIHIHACVCVGMCSRLLRKRCTSNLLLRKTNFKSI